MITLITGKPGSGKTLHMISMLAKRKDLQGRPLYIDGIPDVDPDKIPHEPLPEGKDGSNWDEWLPENAILVIDECQRYWRQRPNGSAVPPAVQAMETHRHRGVDLFLLTQHPRLIDVNVKSFVEEHKHISRGQLGNRRMWIWRDKVGSPENRQDISDAIVSSYRLDKSAFKLYKSAELHTKIKTKRSMWVWLAPLILLGTLAAFAWTYFALQDLFGDDQPQSEAALAASAPNQAEGEALAAPYAEAGHIPPQQPRADQPKTLKPDDYIPTMDGKPWTAPVYAPHNTQIATMPYPVGCVQSGQDCTCYTEQATPIRGMDKGLCLDFVEHGIYNPYKAAQSTTPPAAQSSDG